jgi:UDPglucose--hexose-1-phosphate uridylyltransferase
MSEYRQDPLSRRWVIIGCDERATRPNEFVEATVRQKNVACPFCAGNEGETPPPVASYSGPDNGEWLVRVVPNKYPAVTAEAAPCSTCQPLSPDASAGMVPGFGRHEVIIESPRHVASLSELTATEGDLVFTAYRDRIRELKADGRFRYVQIFKNVGAAAGASLEHVHSQLLALPGIPEVLQQELTSSEEFFRQQGRSLLSELIGQELASGQLVVGQTQHLVAFCPFASRFPYEVWIAPSRQRSQFEAVENGELGELSTLTRDIVGRIEKVMGQSAYNYFLHSLPFDTTAHDHYHWHIEIIPRLTKVAGFEWSTGCFINPYPPESAAAHLRAADPGAAGSADSSAWKR